MNNISEHILQVAHLEADITKTDWDNQWLSLQQQLTANTTPSLPNRASNTAPILRNDYVTHRSYNWPKFTAATPLLQNAGATDAD